WLAELVAQLNKAHASFVFDGVIGHVDDAIGTRVGGKLGIARVLGSFATMLAKAAALSAKFTLSEPPLVRTKTTQPGELRQLTVKYAFDPDSWEDIRGCINTFMSPFGIEIPGSQSGEGSNIDV